MTFLLIFVSLAMGAGLQYVRLPVSHERFRKILTNYIFWIAWPALIFKYLVGMEFEWQQLLLGTVGWLNFFCGLVLFSLLKKVIGFNQKSLGALVLVGGFGNTSFLGLAVVGGLFGESVLADAIIFDLLGTFILVNTLGVALAFYYSGENAPAGDIFKKIISFPTIWFFLIALSMNTFDWVWPEELNSLWGIFGSTLAPAGLVVVGMQLKWGTFRESLGLIALGVVFRIVLAPLVTLLVFQFFFDPLTLSVAVVMASMAPMVTASIIASDQGLNPSLCSALVTAGTLLSAITIPFWYFVTSVL